MVQQNVSRRGTVETDIVDDTSGGRRRPADRQRAVGAREPVGVTMIARGVFIDGEVSGGEDIYIEGEVDGTIELREHVVTVGPQGRVKAEVLAKSVVVLGSAHGLITAVEKVSIEGSGRVEGVISAPRVAIVAGAHFQGRIDM